MELIKTEKLNKLFSYYHPLLTKKQAEYFKLYYYEDYSLAEIAEISNVSRSAVYDQLQNVEKKLNELENKLKLEEKETLRRKYYDKYIKTNDSKYLKMMIEVDEQDE